MTSAGLVASFPTKETETRHRLDGKTCWHFSYHGLTCDTYDALRARAAGHCEICGTAEEKTRRGTLVIDHFRGWRASFTRGLLCDKCNAGVMACHDGKKIWGANRRWQAKVIEYEQNSWDTPSDLARADMALRVELFRRDDPRYVDSYALYRQELAGQVAPPAPRISLAGGPEAIAARVRKNLPATQVRRLARLLLTVVPKEN